MSPEKHYGWLERNKVRGGDQLFMQNSHSGPGQFSSLISYGALKNRPKPKLQPPPIIFWRSLLATLVETPPWITSKCHFPLIIKRGYSSDFFAYNKLSKGWLTNSRLPLDLHPWLILSTTLRGIDWARCGFWISIQNLLAIMSLNVDLTWQGNLICEVHMN